jgi:opacity protein-like surface antigen
MSGCAAKSKSPAIGTSLAAMARFQHREVSSQRLQMPAGDVDVFFVLGNLWVDVPVGETFSPYIGAGLGIGFIDFVGEGASGLAYQLGSGVSVGVTPSLAVDLGYRFKAINNAEDQDGVAADYSSHNILAGVRWGF